MSFSKVFVNLIFLLLLLVLLALPVTTFGILKIDPSFRPNVGSVSGMQDVRVDFNEEKNCFCPCGSTSSYPTR